MSLELDDRQRAMLLEMGVHVWLPGTAFAPVSAQPDAPTAQVAPVQIIRTPPAQVPSGPQTEEAVVATQPVADQGWDALVQSAGSCQACGLCAGRKLSTLRAPTGPADWMVVGDPPDEDEDRAGYPFADQCGVLLDNMLKAVQLRRDGQGNNGAYLSNVVKCRPPGGRVPQPGELEVCASYLQREIALVQPKVIVAMGRFAVQVLLSEHPQQVNLPLGKQRGAVYHFGGVPVVVTYHPKVLLRASADKAKAWADLCLAVDVVRGPSASLQSSI